MALSLFAFQMPTLPRLSAVAILFGVTLLAALPLNESLAQDKYELSADSKKQPNVPEGKVEGPFTQRSKIFPGTVRRYWIYVPQQYEAGKKTCVSIIQDGLGRANGWRVPIVFDNLIHQKAIPTMIGIFIEPGVVPATHENAQPRFNRSFEYDSLGDRYARFLIEEILPAVASKYTISSDPNDRMLAGASSGAICAFNAAWERPDAFRRVFSAIGTYVSLRGGHEFPMLVRKTEPKPIRVYLQDGDKDLDIYAGSWWVANQDMLASFAWAGYDVKHVWGKGGHNGNHSRALFPEAMRWLWRNYPEPIKAATSGKGRRTDLLIPGEDWELVGKGYRFTEGPVVNKKGELFFTDIPNNRIHKVNGEGNVVTFAENTGGANGLAFGPDGKLYACANRKKQIVAYDMSGKATVIVDQVTSNDLVVSHRGHIYFTDPTNDRVYLIVDGKAKVVASKLGRPNGIALSPDQSYLYVANTAGPHSYSLRIGKDGQLTAREPLLHLHVPYGQAGTGADGMAVDTEGRVYVTTRMGIQVCDQLGRVHFIIRKPQSAWLANVTFGGPDGSHLFATCGDKVYRRKIKAKGVQPWATPVKPPKPRL